ncbi:MAG: metallophosphoesterase [Bacteroidota bacterium]|nr:metallophosphoesterase [Bacteroidota bacterium]
MGCRTGAAGSDVLSKGHRPGEERGRGLMITCWFVSDLHGHAGRFRTLEHALKASPPDILFIGGDIFPGGLRIAAGEKHRSSFAEETLFACFSRVRSQLGRQYPSVYLIAGNDDPRILESDFLEGERRGYWHYAHMRRFEDRAYLVAGYSCVPPTPFLLKDWERYDVSRFVDPGCMAPEDGRFTVEQDLELLRYRTIADDLEELTAGCEPSRLVLLFHAPPYRTALDRAALDGKMFDHAPLDVHVGSVAIRRLIERLQPRVTMHGHVHESARLTGAWWEDIGSTRAFGAAHDNHRLALVRFDLDNPRDAERVLL